VGIEACASSHHWSRELKVLGHTVKLMPPAYVKPYVKRQKNDACLCRKLKPAHSSDAARRGSHMT
jgi:transposase